MEDRSWRRGAASALALIVAAATWLFGRQRLGQLASVAVGGARRMAGWWRERPGERQRRLKDLARIPLPNLYELHPDARAATPREIGIRSIDVDAIIGTAVGGPTQRGSDFKPLPPFRSQNWLARWQRIRRGIDTLAILPPIDVVRYPPGGQYWVTDGHNRVAAALEFGQVEIDANVTELVPIGQNPSERPGDLAAALAGTRSLRAAGQGGRLESVPDDVVLGVPGREDGAGPRPTWEDPVREKPAEPAPDS